MLEEEVPSATSENVTVEAEASKDARIEELKQALSAANDAIANDDEIVQKWEGKNRLCNFCDSHFRVVGSAIVNFCVCGIVERTVSLETTISSLQAQLQEQQADAENAISQWQDACTAAEEKCVGLETELAASKEGSHSVKGEASYNELKEAFAKKQSELDEAQRSIERSKKSIQELEGMFQEFRFGNTGLVIENSVTHSPSAFRPSFESFVDSGTEGS